MQVPSPSDAPPTHYRNGLKLGRKPLLKRRDVARLESFTVSDFIDFSKSTCLDTIPVQRMARYRQIRWPFYHQFTVVTTVKISPSALKPEMFSLRSKEGRNVLLDDLDPEANGISFRIDRGSRSELEIEGFELASQANFDRVEIILPGAKPLGGPEARDFEVTWCLTRKPGIEPSLFSLCVGDIALFAKWVSNLNKHYDLLRNNCWILSTSISALTTFHYLQHEFDQASHKELAAMRSAGPIRSRVSMFFSGPNRFHHWVEEDKYRRQAEDIGKHESAKDRTEMPFLRHPDRAGFGLLLSTCATSSTSPAGFANQPDGVLFFICLRLLLLISDWRTQIEEDPSLREDFHRFIDEFSSIPSHRTLASLRPDIREAYTITMSYVYLFSVTSDGVYVIPGLRTESVGNHFIRSIPQYIDYLERGDDSNDSDLNAFLPLVTYLVPFQDELQELIQVDTLSVLVRIFRRQHDLTAQSQSNFETVLLRFCSHNPASRQYFLKSDALLYVKDMLMRKPQSPSLLSALSFLKRSESVAEFHDRLISCGVLVPLARCLASTNFHDETMYGVLEIFYSVVEHNKTEHLLERPILSYLAQSLNHPFSRISFGVCGIIFTSLCALGDDAKKEVVNVGALPGLCRLAHPDSYNTNYQGSEQVQHEDLLVAIAGIDGSCAAKVAKARKLYYRGFKVQTLDAPRPTIRERARAIVTRPST